MEHSMNLRPLLLTAVLGVTTVALADNSFDRTLNVSAQPDLYVSTGSGNIHIVAGSGGQIHIVGHVHAGWSAFGDVNSRVQHIVENPPIVQNGNTVRVGEVTDHSLFNNISIDYDINVPADVALNLHSGSGDVEVNNAGRFLSATSGSGNVRASGVHGPADLESGSGELTLEDTGAGDVKARTGSGDVRIHGFDGSFTAKTGSGDIEAYGHLQNGGMIATGSGDVRLRLTPDSRFTLEAATGSGDIRVKMPGVIAANSESSRHHVTTQVNGGGPALQIRTGSGDVEISPR
jgi:Putative adhesin